MKSLFYSVLITLSLSLAAQAKDTPKKAAAQPAPKTAEAKPVASTAKILDLSQGTGSVNFKAEGKPGFMKINGEGDKALGQVKLDGKEVSGTLSFDLNSLSTKISLRDQHMKEKYLETGKFPKAELTITKLTLPKSIAEQNSGEVPFEGKLKLHGIENTIQNGKVKYSMSGKDVEFEAEFDTTIKAHEIPVPSYAGITVADNVKVIVKAKAPVQ